MNSKTLTLIIAGLLIFIGIVKPDLSGWLNKPKPEPTPVNIVETLKVEKPSDPAILEKCDVVIKALKAGPKSRNVDAKKLAALYLDIATLVELDGEDLVVRNTDEIRQANSISGAMLRLDMKGKYPDLGKACEDLVVTAVGADNVALDAELRSKAVLGFKALAWACYTGAE